MTMLTLRFTETAQQSIEDQIDYLAGYIGEGPAFQRLNSVIDDCILRLGSAPKGCPLSLQASELGILHYRELNTDGYRVFYEIVEADQAISVGLVLRDKQSVERALVRYCLLHTL